MLSAIDYSPVNRAFEVAWGIMWLTWFKSVPRAVHSLDDDSPCFQGATEPAVGTKRSALIEFCVDLSTL